MKIGIIGAGNMGSALIDGIHQKNPDWQLYVFDNDVTKTNVYQRNGIITVTEDISQVCKNANIVLFALKPNIVLDVIEEHKEHLKDHLVISIAAGIHLDEYQKRLGSSRIIRAMPNMPAQIGMGMTTVCLGDHVKETEKEQMMDIFNCVGKTLIVQEKDMDATTALAGSSPAFVFMFIEAMADAGVKLGLSRQQSHLLSAQAVMGSAAMVLENNEHPAFLKDKICSPGGTTIEGVSTLEKEGFRKSIIKALETTYEKSKDMGKKE